VPGTGAGLLRKALAGRIYSYGYRSKKRTSYGKAACPAAAFRISFPKIPGVTPAARPFPGSGEDFQVYRNLQFSQTHITQNRYLNLSPIRV
jgi:hypothetical protein